MALKVMRLGVRRTGLNVPLPAAQTTTGKRLCFPGLRRLLLTVRVSVGVPHSVLCSGLVRKWEMHAGPSQGIWHRVAARLVTTSFCRPLQRSPHTPVRRPDLPSVNTCFSSLSALLAWRWSGAVQGVSAPSAPLPCKNWEKVGKSPALLSLRAMIPRCLPWLPKHPQQASTLSPPPTTFLIMPPGWFLPPVRIPQSPPGASCMHLQNSSLSPLVLAGMGGPDQDSTGVSTVLDAGLDAGCWMQVLMYLPCRLSYRSSEACGAGWGARGLEAHGSTGPGLHPGMLGAMGVWGGRQ